MDEGDPALARGGTAEIFHWGQGMEPWIVADVLQLVYDLAEEKNLSLELCARKYAVLRLPESGTGGWSFHPLLGFDRKD